MVRTLGDFSSPNQLAVPGRRVAIGSVNGMNGRNYTTPGTAMQSLPRDISLGFVGAAAGGASVTPRLLQAFVPELMSLRRNHTSTVKSAFGQQLEVWGRFQISAAGGAMAVPHPFGIAVLVGGSDERTTIGVDPLRKLLCIDGRAQGNPQPRCAPWRSSSEQHGNRREVVTIHAIIDHSILEVIVNNVTAITCSVAPSGPHAGGLALFGLGSEDAVAVDAWTLADANNCS